jgi:cell shape-determining protein MreC
LSALTKILIVLLTLSSIFLCGIVVTYVANADNFKEQNEVLRTKLNAAEENKKSAQEQLKENIAKSQRLETKLNNEIASLNIKFSKVENDLKDAEREKATLLAKVESWVSITENLTKTTDDQGQLLKNTLNELSEVKAEQIKQEKELKETTATLIEKMAIIATLEEEKKRLLEEKTELRRQLDQHLQQFGKLAAPPALVTPEKGKARPAAPPARDIALKGLVDAVDLKNSLASISIGKADNVKEGMKFYVTRGDEFICEILIIDIDAEQAVGILERVQQQPRVGDNVSTNL